MNVFFIRHAETYNNILRESNPDEYKKKRDMDAKITERGFKQLNLDLHENGGLYLENVPASGYGKSWFEKTFPTLELPGTFTDAGWFLLGRKETPEDTINRAERVISWLKDMTQKASGETKSIIIIAHGGFLDTLLGVMTDRAKGSDFKFAAENTGITLVHFNKVGRTLLKYFNLTEHLNEGIEELINNLTNDIKTMILESENHSPRGKQFMGEFPSIFKPE